MGNRLPMLKARDIIRALKLLGFQEFRQSGAHLFLKHPDGRVTTIPKHSGNDIGRGLMRQILKDIHITPEEFIKYL